MGQIVDISKRAKQIRAKVIAQYMARNDIKQCVCFSCGNASRALSATGLQVVAIAPNGDLEARRWWTMEEIRKTFPSSFDATSGHLPIDIINEIVKSFRKEFSGVFATGQTYDIPTGSGETILCLKLAFPEIDFVARYKTGDAACNPDENAPLLPLIKSLFKWFDVCSK